MNFMPPVITIVGFSDSGKTTLTVNLVSELTRRGYRVGTVKHASHGFSMDMEGKDSFRHRQAGASMVVTASPEEIAMVKSADGNDLDSVLMLFQDVDVVLVEGYKNADKPKIEVFRSQIRQQPVIPENGQLLARVTDGEHSAKVPVFRFEDINAICDLIVSFAKL
jgi:molybdopterin-guanine dinucleotide biosynthesis adapter protein